MTLRRVTNALLSALLSPPCAACSTILDQPLDGAVCDGCWSAVVAHGTPVHTMCASVVQSAAIGEYAGTLRAIIHALKYDGRRSIAPRLARLMLEHGRAVLADADCVVPVPLHRTRERERGFNQADDLARGLELPVLRVLKRTKVTRPQVELPAQQRHLNVSGAFDLEYRGHQGRPLKNTIVVLVDDVTTTGATLDACARVLKDAGAREVRALTAARVVSVPR